MCFGGRQVFCLPTEVWSADDAALWRIFSSYLLHQPIGKKDFWPAVIQTQWQNKVDLSIKHIKLWTPFKNLFIYLFILEPIWSGWTIPSKHPTENNLLQKFSIKTTNITYSMIEIQYKILKHVKTIFSFKWYGKSCVNMASFYGTLSFDKNDLKVVFKVLKLTL